MTESISSDQSLVARLRSGEEEAASEFYDRYVKRVFGLVHHQMAEHLQAFVQPEDIVQSVFKSIFRGLNAGDYNAPQSGTLWHLIAIVAVHKIQRNTRHRLASKRDGRRTQSLETLENFDIASDVSPEEFEVAIREAIDGLKPLEQDVVILRVQGFSVEEISNKLERSRRGIERSLQSIRERLISTIENCEFGNE